MKRIIAVLLAMIMVLSLAACGEEKTAENKPKAEKYCSSCGEGLDKSDAFCSNCGAEVKNQDSDDKKESIFGDVEVGDYIKFGNYNNKEIEWLVLEKTNDRIFVISDEPLEERPYHTEDVYVTWETCSLRAWLNNDFINSVFSKAERKMIPTVTVTADPNPEYDYDPGNDTRDKVFLLSVAEVDEYLSSEEDRLRDCTWWLRSPGLMGAACVTGTDWDGAHGVISGCFFDGDFIAVRPAMWIDIS